MQYVTQRFENTQGGLAQKDTYSRQMAAQGYHVVSEQLEAGHSKAESNAAFFPYASRACSWLDERPVSWS